MKKITRKGQLSGLSGFALAIVSIGIVLAVGLLVLQEMASTASGSASGTYGTASGTTTVASNATESVITKIAGAPVWIGLLVIVVFATAVLGFFYMRS